MACVQVRASVEERVQQAMSRAQALEQEMEMVHQQHHSELQVRGVRAFAGAGFEQGEPGAALLHLT